jgi:hypothetical protein
MCDDLIDINLHKENLYAQAQDLRSICSSNGIGGKQYLNRLYKLLLDDISCSTSTVYDNLFHKVINEGYKIKTTDLLNKIKEVAKKLFSDYINIIQISNVGNMIQITIQENDISSFNIKAEKKLESLCNEFSAKYNHYLNQQRYNDKIFRTAKSSKIAAWFACGIAAWLACGAAMVGVILDVFQKMK